MTFSKSSFWLVLILILSLIGILDAGYLSWLEWQGQNGAACDLGGFNCNAVISSRYSHFMGISLAYLGLAYYLGLFFLSLAYLDFRRQLLFSLLGLGLALGLLSSLVLFYLQAFVLRSFCLYCLVSEIVILLMSLVYLIFKTSFLKKIS